MKTCGKEIRHGGLTFMPLIVVCSAAYMKLEKLMLPIRAAISLQESTSKSKIRMPAVGNADGSC